MTTTGNKEDKHTSPEKTTTITPDNTETSQTTDPHPIKAITPTAEKMHLDRPMSDSGGESFHSADNPPSPCEELMGPPTGHSSPVSEEEIYKISKSGRGDIFPRNSSASPDFISKKSHLASRYTAVVSPITIVTKNKNPSNHFIGNIIKREESALNQQQDNLREKDEYLNNPFYKSKINHLSDKYVGDGEQRKGFVGLYKDKQEPRSQVNSERNRHEDMEVQSEHKHRTDTTVVHRGHKDQNTDVYIHRSHDSSRGQRPHPYDQRQYPRQHLSQSLLLTHNSQQSGGQQSVPPHPPHFPLSMQEQHMMYTGGTSAFSLAGGGSGNKKLEAACLVCGDRASGKHYGVLSCDGCRGFFKRSIRRSMQYVCKESGTCVVDVARRNQCQACRFTKCINVNMNKDAVQHERAPRCYQFRKESPEPELSVNGITANGGTSNPGTKALHVTSAYPVPHHQSGSLLQVAPGHMWDRTRLPYLNLPYPAPLINNSSATPKDHPVYSHPHLTHPHPFNPLLLPPNHPAAATAAMLNLDRKYSEERNRCSSGDDDTKHNTHSPSSQSTISDSSSTGSSAASGGPPRHHPHARPHTQHPTNNHHKPSQHLITPLVRPTPIPPTPVTPFLLPPAQHPPLGGLPPSAFESVHESAAKLLFMSVKWARSLPAFLQLGFRDQAILLEESWCELFILNAAQWALPIDTASLLPQKDTSEESAAHRAYIRALRATADRTRRHRLDSTEYSCLKALVLFKSEVLDLRDSPLVETLQDQAQLMLRDHISRTHPDRAADHISRPHPDRAARFGRLMLLLPQLRTISPRIVEDIFFRKTIGNVPIERLLCDMFKSC